MSGYRFTPQAVDDLFEIWHYIASDNREAANRVESAIFEAYAFVAESPLRGHRRTDLTPLALRFWNVQPYRNYVIVYDPATKPVHVVRILHGACDVPAILGKT